MMMILLLLWISIYAVQKQMKVGSSLCDWFMDIILKYDSLPLSERNPGKVEKSKSQGTEICTCKYKSYSWYHYRSLIFLLFNTNHWYFIILLCLLDISVTSCHGTRYSATKSITTSPPSLTPSLHPPPLASLHGIHKNMIIYYADVKLCWKCSTGWRC